MNGDRAEESRAVTTVAEIVTPIHMLDRALTRGADLTTIEKLMDLQDRFEANEAKKAFVVAMAAFKRKAPEIIKERQASFNTTKYTYATLANVCTSILPALSEQGLSHTWEIDQQEKFIEVTCIITHEKGHSERVKLRAAPDATGSKNPIQQLGSTISYLQRYSLLAATGLAAGDQDDDGNGVGRRQEERPVRPTRPQTHAEPPRDHETGEITPHHIEVGYIQTDEGDKSDWPGWGKAFIAAVKNAKTLDELRVWETLNETALASCAENGPKAHSSIVGALKKRRAEIAGTAAPAIPSFDIVDQDGVVHAAAGRAGTAVPFFLDLMAQAAKRGGDKALEGLWESNGLFLTQLRERGHDAEADQLGKEYGEMLAEITRARQAETAAKEAAKAAAPAQDARAAQETAQEEQFTEAPKDAGAVQDAPASSILEPAAPRYHRDMPEYTAKLIVWARAASPADVQRHAAAHQKQIDFIRENRAADWVALSAVLGKKGVGHG